MAYDVHEPMACCGLMEAAGFSPHSGDCRRELQHMQKRASDQRRACLLITLSSVQVEEKRVAEEEGFKVIHQFYNPRSFNQCYIMACNQEI